MEERTILYCDSLEECEAELRQSTWQRVQVNITAPTVIVRQVILPGAR